MYRANVLSCAVLLFTAGCGSESPAPGSAPAIDFRWTSGYAQGTVEAIIENQNDSSINIYCPAGQIPPTPGMFVKVSKVHPKPGEKITVQIVVDGKSHPFGLDEIQFEASGRAGLQSLRLLIDALANSKGQSFVVEFPQFGISERFSLLDASTVFESADDFLQGCS